LQHPSDAEKKFTGQRYVVGANTELPVVAYLNHGGLSYQPLEPQSIAALPVASVDRQFWITAGSRDDAMKTLKVKFPGGVLRPHYSDFNLAEIYFTYEVNK
jgi:hypothetical protein